MSCVVHRYPKDCTGVTGCSCYNDSLCSCNCNNTICSCNIVCTTQVLCACQCNNCAKNMGSSATLNWDNNTATTDVSVGNKIISSHISEIRNIIDILHTNRTNTTKYNKNCACNCANSVNWTSSYNLSSKILANTWAEVIKNMSNLYPSYTLSIASGGKITSANIVSMRKRIIQINSYCWCDCNNDNTVTYCNCNTQGFTCSAQCNCNFYCNCYNAYTGTCNCNYSDERLKKNINYL